MACGKRAGAGGYAQLVAHGLDRAGASARHQGDVRAAGEGAQGGLIKIDTSDIRVAPSLRAPREGRAGSLGEQPSIPGMRCSRRPGTVARRPERPAAIILVAQARFQNLHAATIAALRQSQGQRQAGQAAADHDQVGMLSHGARSTVPTPPAGRGHARRPADEAAATRRNSALTVPHDLLWQPS